MNLVNLNGNDNAGCILIMTETVYPQNALTYTQASTQDRKHIIVAQ